MKEKVTAIVLAAGKGSRMHSEIQKQYMTLLDRPVITYALEAFEKDYHLKVDGIYDKNDSMILLSALSYHIYQKTIDQGYQKVEELIK